MTKFATCGHEIHHPTEEEYVITIKDTTIDYSADRVVRCLNTLVVCEECLRFYRKEGIILDTRKQEKEYLYGERT